MCRNSVQGDALKRRHGENYKNSQLIMCQDGPREHNFQLTDPSLGRRLTVSPRLCVATFGDWRRINSLKGVMKN